MGSRYDSTATQAHTRLGNPTVTCAVVLGLATWRLSKPRRRMAHRNAVSTLARDPTLMRHRSRRGLQHSMGKTKLLTMSSARARNQTELVGLPPPGVGICTVSPANRPHQVPYEEPTTLHCRPTPPSCRLPEPAPYIYFHELAAPCVEHPPIRVVRSTTRPLHICQSLPLPPPCPAVRPPPRVRPAAGAPRW